MSMLFMDSHLGNIGVSGLQGCKMRQNAAQGCNLCATKTAPESCLYQHRRGRLPDRLGRADPAHGGGTHMKGAETRLADAVPPAMCRSRTRPSSVTLPAR